MGYRKEGRWERGGAVVLEDGGWVRKVYGTLSMASLPTVRLLPFLVRPRKRVADQLILLEGQNSSEEYRGCTKASTH